jgi:hypothetical protein
MLSRIWCVHLFLDHQAIETHATRIGGSLNTPSVDFFRAAFAMEF